jgi:hypothetical protein
MNYIGAKVSLEHKPPRISFRTLAVEAVVMIVAANFLVNIISV